VVVSAANSALWIYINGKYVPAAEATVSVFDRSFVYGDGAFEGIEIEDGGIFKLDEHVDRFYRSAAFLRIAMPIPKSEMRAAIVEVVRRSALRNGYVRPLVSRGAGPLGLERVSELGPPTVVVMPQHRPPKEARTYRAVVLATRRNPAQCLDPRVKSNNYLNNVLGKFEQLDAGADAGIFLDVDGFVSECCGENLFAVVQGRLVTPPATRTLDGITRQTVIALARDAAIAVAETEMTRYDLYTADELFLTATLSGIGYIVEVDRRRIGSGEPGPVSRRLYELYRACKKRESVVVL
jgi:branched-chain amino acid aminotransferase